MPEGRSLEVAQPLVGGIADDVLDGLVVLYQFDVARRLPRTPCSWAATPPDSRSEGGLVEGRSVARPTARGADGGQMGGRLSGVEIRFSTSDSSTVRMQ
jgi:hypothetical protein